MIYGERIRFRGVERTDIPVFVPWLNDPEVNRGIAIYWPMSQAEEERWFEKMLSRPIDEHVLGVEVRLPPAGQEGESWKLIGTTGLMGIDWRDRNAELGILIGEKSYWDHGYGTETVRLLAKYGFDTLNLHRIFLRVFESNPRAIRAYEKAGFTHEGRQRQAQFSDGCYQDVLMMSILEAEFRLV